MLTTSLPFFEFRKGIYEVDEFECVSMFVIVGEEKALVIDTGVGIGDFRWLLENKILKGLPYEVVASHNHLDHIGGAYSFENIYMHEADIDEKEIALASDLEERRDYARIIIKREGKYYPYSVEEDILPWDRYPNFIPIKDGHVFDLGGRKVSAYHCPGHTKGELVFIDDLTRTLIVGDAFNCNFYFRTDIGKDPKDDLKVAYEAAKRIYDMNDRYDMVINSHHDFRGFGNPLNPDVMPNLIECLASLAEGRAEFRKVPDPLSEDGGYRTSAIYGDVEVSVFDPSDPDLSIDKL